MKVKTNKYCNLSNNTTIVELTEGQWTTLDTIDWVKLIVFGWAAVFDRNTGKYYAKITNRSRRTMHRAIMKITDSSIKVDHINRDTLDNRRQNLRVCSDSQNKMNSKKYKNNSSGYIGVYKKTDRNVWFALIEVNHKTIYLGSFPYTKEGALEAAMVRDRAAIQYHKEFASLNFPITNYI